MYRDWPTLNLRGGTLIFIRATEFQILQWVSPQKFRPKTWRGLVEWGAAWWEMVKVCTLKWRWVHTLPWSCIYYPTPSSCWTTKYKVSQPFSIEEVINSIFIKNMIFYKTIIGGGSCSVAPCSVQYYSRPGDFRSKYLETKIRYLI